MITLKSNDPSNVVIVPGFHVVHCSRRIFVLSAGTERLVRMVRLVTLDMVGTVLRFSRPPAAQYQEVAARHGHNLRLEDLSSSFKEQWREKNINFPHFGSTTPGLSSTMWWHQLVKVTFPSLLPLILTISALQETFRSVVGADYEERVFSEVASELYSYYHSPRPYQLLPDAVETLAELRSRNIRVGKTR